MKKLIITLIIGLLVGNAVYAENVVVNPTQKILYTKLNNGIYTTKVKTDEGMYRIFVIQSGYGAGITAVKIEKKKDK